jgi:NDP-sugar pyrophosphorylase family protein
MKGVIVATAVDHRPWHEARRGVPATADASNRPLIDHVIEAFVQAGFEELCVVVGHNGEILRQYLEDSSRYGIAVYCLYNPRYVWGSATSVYAARAFVRGERFVVAVADHPTSACSLSLLLQRHWTSHVLCVQQRRGGGATSRTAIRVGLDPWGRVEGVGRALKRWQAVSTGVYLFQPHAFDTWRGSGQQPGARGSITGLVRRILEAGEVVDACDTSALLRQALLLRSEHLRQRPMLTVGLSREELVA